LKEVSVEPREPPPAYDDDEVTEVMRRRHAAVAAPRSVVAAIARRATGQEAEGIERIVRGYESEVYRVSLRAGEPVVVRIRRYGEVSYASEAWAIAACRAAGAPVPEVLLVEDVPLECEEREVMVQRVVPGRPLSERQGALSREELARVWAQAGEALARIHSVRAGGFYKMRRPGEWDFPDWESLAGAGGPDRRSDLEQLRGGGLGDADIEALLELLARSEQAPPCLEPSLLHGDFLPGHLFVDDTLRLCGVIDFGDFQGGDRIYDLANLRMSAPDVEIGWLRAGYGDQEPFDERLEERLLLAGAEHQVGYLAHYLRQGNAEEAAAVERALRATLAAWRARAHS
jgi:Ser/Thr protein kinase RdoA (MazF antagonist)